jgi:hypothetical protein
VRDEVGLRSVGRALHVTQARKARGDEDVRAVRDRLEPASDLGQFEPFADGLPSCDVTEANAERREPDDAI